MKIDELLKENKVTLFVFYSQQWERDGFYFPDLRTIYVSAALSNADRERVILHELGHINHNPVNYSRCLLQYENQADRFMVRELLKEYLSKYDPNDFNWLYFAETNKIATSWGEQMIQEEFYKLVS